MFGTLFFIKWFFGDFSRVFRDPPLLGVEKSTFWDNSLIKELFHPPDPANMPLFEARETALLAPKSEKRAKTGPFLSDFVANRAIKRDRDRGLMYMRRVIHEVLRSLPTRCRNPASVDNERYLDAMDSYASHPDTSATGTTSVGCVKSTEMLLMRRASEGRLV